MLSKHKFSRVGCKIIPLNPKVFMRFLNLLFILVSNLISKFMSLQITDV